MGADRPSWSLVWLLFRIGILVVVTPREGGDNSRNRLHRTLYDFNSHPREGGDFSNIDHAIPVGDISIPTPAKGVTLPLYGSRGYLAISILTPARGVTCPQKRTAIHAAISILTPAKGGDSQLSASAASASDFNSHPRKGGDSKNAHISHREFSIFAVFSAKRF